MERSDDLRKKKGLRRLYDESFGAYAMENNVPRVLVIGNGDYFSDAMSNRYRGASTEVFNSIANWMRDRPAIANVVAKQYGMYKVRRDASSVPLIVFPVGVTLLVIVALGLGMWAFRRS